MMRLLDQRRKKKALQQSRRKESEEKHHNIRATLEEEAQLKKNMIKAKRTSEEIRREEQLKAQHEKEKEEKEKKLEDQWTRRELARAKRMMREKLLEAQKKEEMQERVLRREEMVAKQWETQEDNLTRIREYRQKSALRKEVFVAERLEKKVEDLCRKYTAGPKRGRRRFPPINPKLTTNMTTWNVKEKLCKEKEEAGSTTTSTDKLPPIIYSDESGIDKRRSAPPSMVIYETSSLPSVKSSEFSKEIVTILEEFEPPTSVESMGDAPVSMPEVLDSFTVVARQLVSGVFKELKADPEFDDVEWEEGNDGTWKTDGQKDRAPSERSGSPDVYIDASEVSPYASLMVANALKNVLNQVEDTQPSLIQISTIEERARSIVSKVLEGAIESICPSSLVKMVKNETAEDVSDGGQRSYDLDDRLGEETDEAVDLSSIIEIFKEPVDSIPSITHTQASSESESEAEEEGDTVIGIVENPILMDEIQHTGGPSGDTDVDEGLHVVMHKADDGHLVMEGAVLTAEHDTQTITERILSNITLERVSGSLSGASSSRSGLTREEPAAPSSSSSEDEGEEIPEDHSSIIPIYQKNLINVGGHMVESHLSAISMKPEADGKFPSKGKCAARNSFRNIFRPDMTYCQGSARMLRDTLVRDISSRHTASLPTGMDMVCEVLEKEEQDIMEKHSDEALVGVEETEGLCYLPTKRRPKPAPPQTPAPEPVQGETPATETVPATEPPSASEPVQAERTPATEPLQARTDLDAEPEQVKKKSSDTPGNDGVLTAKSSEDRSTKPDGDRKEALVDADGTGGADAAASATEGNPKATTSYHTEHQVIPSSKSAEEAQERALSAERESTRREVSTHSVDASPNLADSSSGEDSESPKGRKSKKVKSSGGLSGLFSRISHVFSGTRKSSASIPSHESSSEPASRRSSKKSIERFTVGALSDGTQAPEEAPSSETSQPSSVGLHQDSSNLQRSSIHRGSSIHHGASVHFTSKTVDPPARRESIYASHRPQTPIPAMHHDPTLDDDDDDDDDEVVIDAENPKGDGPVREGVKEASSEALATGEDARAADNEEEKQTPPTDQQEKAVAMESDTEAESVVMETATTGEAEATPAENELPKATDESSVAMETDGHTPEEETHEPETKGADERTEPAENTDDVPGEKEVQEDKPASEDDPHAEDPSNPNTPTERPLQVENDSNNSNTDSGAKSPDRLPSIRTSQLQSPRTPSSSSSSRAYGVPSQSGSRASQASPRPMPPTLRPPSDRSPSGSHSMTITGHSLTPAGSKMVKSVTSTSEKGRHGALSPKAPASMRNSRAGLSNHKRISSPRKKSTVSSQSAGKVKSAYGSSAGLSVSGYQILPTKPSKSTSSSRRASRNQASLISATELGTSRTSRTKQGSRGSVIMPRPPSGIKPSGSAQSGHRGVRQPSGTQAVSNPTLTTSKGSSSVLVNHRSSNERLLPRRASLEKENRMERLSTESVTSKRSSKEKVGKKKSSGTQQATEEPVDDQKPAAPMPKIKESLTPRPPSQPATSKQRSRPNSGIKRAAEDNTSDAGQNMLGNDQAASED
ncbi:serine/arginine repetitive matrix protein 2-like [Lytechinus variegatus]|uniref:serine/arginine repetitive matrix protein 2-like n=1 Tax=Lytechinus variegatus TaxID=7654 RepID=UPI001BB1651D|nr:serine/arginine repetitive matrix protein 2-like [Lytechinus variegatus]